MTAFSAVIPGWSEGQTRNLRFAFDAKDRAWRGTGHRPGMTFDYFFP